METIMEKNTSSTTPSGVDKTTEDTRNRTSVNDKHCQENHKIPQKTTKRVSVK